MIDPSAGIVLQKKVGDTVKTGPPWLCYMPIAQRGWNKWRQMCVMLIKLVSISPGRHSLYWARSQWNCPGRADGVRV
ncbi:MAG: hypothetical protein RQM92_06595 [Candidatus Syntrophopropionicum ammoniitolerans]